MNSDEEPGSEAISLGNEYLDDQSDLSDSELMTSRPRFTLHSDDDEDDDVSKSFPRKPKQGGGGGTSLAQSAKNFMRKKPLSSNNSSNNNNNSVKNHQKSQKKSSPSSSSRGSLVHGRPGPGDAGQQLAESSSSNSYSTSTMREKLKGLSLPFSSSSSSTSSKKEAARKPLETAVHLDHAVAELSSSVDHRRGDIDLSDQDQWVQPSSSSSSLRANRAASSTRGQFEMDMDPLDFEYTAQKMDSSELTFPLSADGDSDVEDDSEDLETHYRHRAPPPHGHDDDGPKLPWWRLVLLNVYWFAFSLLWFILLVVIVPSQIKELKGDENKGHGMFVLFTVAGAVTFISSLLMGYANDRMAETRFGRRRPLIVAGCLAVVPFLFGTALTKDFGLYVFLYICLTIASVVSTVPYNGLFADVVPMSQHGSASAIMGSLSQTGNLVGASLGLFYVTLGIYVFVIISAIIVISMLITVVSNSEKPTNKAVFKNRPKKQGKKFTFALIKMNCHPRRLYELAILPLIEPLIKSHDFRWVFNMRFVFQLGLYTVQEYLQFWLSNCVDIPDGIGSAETAVSICVLPMLITAIIGSLVGGVISDRLGGKRRILVYLSGGLMVGCSASFMFVRDFYLAAGLSGLFGIGLGCFLAVDFAIVMDVLPSKVDYARDMAVWNCALIIPQVIATPFAGLMLDAFQQAGESLGIECLGYKVIFALASLYFLMGTLFVGKIKGIK